MHPTADKNPALEDWKKNDLLYNFFCFLYWHHQLKNQKKSSQDRIRIQPGMDFYPAQYGYCHPAMLG
jgi:hypothetical protein